MSAVEAVAREVAAVLHNKLFAMNGYSKLPSALRKTDEIVELVTRAAIEALAANVSEETVRPLIAELAPAYDAVRNRSTGRDEVIFSPDESVRAAVLAIRAFLRAVLSEKP